jgi:hypothetical protein
MLMGVISLSGCREHHDPTVWREEFRSPDGAWVATAHTEQYGGFGSAFIGTEVDLVRPDKTYHKGQPFNVLALEPSGPLPATYQLSPANRGGGADLMVHWNGPRALELRYDGKTPVTVQVVRFGDVRISLLNSSTHQTEL